MRRSASLVACFLVAPVMLLAGAVHADVSSPLTVELNLPRFPLAGEEATLECTLESRLALKCVSLTIDLPEGIELVKGSKTWQQDMGAFQKTPLQLTIKVTSSGNKAITATVFCRVDEKTAFSDVSQVFFHSQQAFAFEGHVTGIVPTMAESASLETGEASEPIRLSDYMKQPPQPPYEPEPCSVGPGESRAQQSGSAPEGTLVVSGRWCYYARDDTYTPMQWVYVQLRRGDTDAVLAGSWITDNNGQYTFPAVTNPGAAGFRVKAWCYHYNTHSSDGKALRVVDCGIGRDDGGNLYTVCYSAQTEVATSGDGTYDMGTWHVVNGSIEEPAWWIMMDLNQGFWFPYWWNGGTTMNGGVTVEWSPTSTHGDHNHLDPEDGGNIHLKALSPSVCDEVLHQYGHEVMWDGYGQWMPASDCPSSHYLHYASGPHCAWLEGFAYWFKFAVTNDPVYHWAGGGVLDCENSTWGSYWDNGDQVEGRVAGALWDIGDANVDGTDTSNLSWEYIWDTWYGSANRDNSFAEFWTRWKNAGNPKHHPTKALYQCTIDYNTGPTFSGLPDVSRNENSANDNAIDLWLYAYDPESYDSELGYTIVGNTNPNCGASIDSTGYLDINPTPHWYGTSTVTITCSDGIMQDSDSLVITIARVDDPPSISALPDRIVPKNAHYNNHLDLWGYASDPYDADSALTYAITGNTNPDCGATVSSNRHISINPTTDWTGESNVTVRVTDPDGFWAEDTFVIVVGEMAFSCAHARTFADGSWVFTQNFPTVTAVFPSIFYMEDWNRLSGIRVSWDSAPPIGNYVCAAGQLTSYFGERMIDARIAMNYGPDPDPPAPLYMRNNVIGGASPNAYTRKVPEPGGLGCYNVGLLIATSGEIVATSPPNHFWIDDGSKAKYGAGLDALLVDWHDAGVPVPPLHARVSLTGISGATTLSGATIPYFRPRSAADVRGCGGKAAYLCDTDTATAAAFAEMLLAHNWTTLRYSVAGLPGSLSGFDIIIIGGDTGTWADPARVAKVVDSNRPVVAIGSGGCRFLDQVHSPELNIGWGPSGSGSANSGWAQDTGLGLWYFDHPITIPVGAPMVVQSAGGNYEVYDPPGSVIKIVRDAQLSSYWPIAQEYRFMQWGFSGGPAAMTATGQDLFINCLYYMLGQ